MSICSQKPVALCSTCKMKYCTNRVFVGCIDQAWFILCFIYASYLQQILSEVTTLYSHAAKNTGYRSLNLIIHAPVNELHDSVTTRSTAPSLMLNSHISHSSPSLSPSLCVFIVSHCSSVPSARDYTHGIISGAKLYYCLPVFTNVFSVEKKCGHRWAAGEKMNNTIELRAVGSREHRAAPAHCSSRRSETVHNGKQIQDHGQKPSHHLVSLYWSHVRDV